MPLAPNELTAARRGPAGGACQVRADRSMRNGLPSSATARLGSAKSGEPGMRRFSSASNDFTTPAMPAANWVWPRLFLIDPSTAPPAGAPAKARLSARNSMGSPSCVPVPCASTSWMPPGAMPPSACTSRSSCSWEAALGAVMPLVVPSWLVPEARTTP
ncbi:hypothetical protein GCM10027271_40560 [Saccharopolyspora gloriosae]